MTVGDILVSINQASLDTMLPLTAVQTSADIERYYKEGYSIGITATEFAKKYPRLPVDKIYAAHNMLAPLYYCELDSTTVPIVLSLNIYGDKRLAVNSESDEKFQQRVLDMAEKISSGNAPFIRSYLFSLEDSLRVSVLSKLSPGPQATRQPVSLPAASRVSRTAESSLPISTKVILSSIFRTMRKKRSLSHRLP